MFCLHWYWFNLLEESYLRWPQHDVQPLAGDTSDTLLSSLSSFNTWTYARSTKISPVAFFTSPISTQCSSSFLSIFKVAKKHKQELLKYLFIFPALEFFLSFEVWEMCIAIVETEMHRLEVKHDWRERNLTQPRFLINSWNSAVFSNFELSNVLIHLLDWRPRQRTWCNRLRNQTAKNHVGYTFYWYFYALNSTRWIIIDCFLWGSTHWRRAYWPKECIG